jgi:predicted Zn-dependent protease
MKGILSMSLTNKSTAMITATLLLWSCSTVPVTERKQLRLLPREQILSLSADQYRQFLDEHEVITGTKQAAMVKQVGNKVRQAVESYLHEQGQQDLLKGYAWEFNLVAEESANAFAMPGGKVVVFEGILPIAGDAGGLATIMGHEVAHAVARHGNERMSQALVSQLGGAALGLALSSKPQQTQQVFMAAYGMGTQVGVLLPYSRLQESEADRLGLIFMSLAGYDPRQAIDFWGDMDNRQGKDGAPPEFLSTHPSHASRIEDLRMHMSEALKYYRKGA